MLRNDDTCALCYWDWSNICPDFNCDECDNIRDDGYCNCIFVGEDEECPYFRSIFVFPARHNGKLSAVNNFIEKLISRKRRKNASKTHYRRN